MILKDAVEERWVDSSVYQHGATTPPSSEVVVTKRHLTQAMIPGKHLVKVEISQKLYNEHLASIVASEEK